MRLAAADVGPQPHDEIATGAREAIGSAGDQFAKPLVMRVRPQNSARYQYSATAAPRQTRCRSVACWAIFEVPQCDIVEKFEHLS